MTPELRELLKRHPAPWKLDETPNTPGQYFRDGNGGLIMQKDPDELSRLFVELVNAAAEEQA